MTQLRAGNHFRHQASTKPPLTNGISTASAIGRWTTLGWNSKESM